MPFWLKTLLKKILFISDRILNKKFIEFHSFDFDSNQVMPKGGHLVMAKCCELLEAAGVKYRITDGTVLGLYRDGEFIAHDNDIDIDVLTKISVRNIVKMMRNEGMTLGRKAYYEGEIQQLVFYSKTNIIFDMLFWNQKGDVIFNYSERSFVRSHPYSYFEEMETLNFKGKAYPIPSPIVEWLEFRYGNDWNIPKTYKGDWKEECGDLKKI